MSSTSQPEQDRPQSPDAKATVLWTNPITLVGLLFVGAGVLLLLTFWLFMAVSPAHRDNDYLNIIGYMILPGVLVTGLVLCPIGIAVKRWRLRRFHEGWQISARSAIIFLAVTFFLMLPLLGVSGYQGYHYTESSEFCGSCHSVMEPQYTTYQQSPHARVTCAECHIGAGASPFVKSKLSGARQVVAVALNTFPRPIPPAITQLRPSRETCEQCHWPEQFYGAQLKNLVRFSPDEQNTRHEFEMLLKVGGNNAHLGRAEGIHMHMIGKVEYIATDPGLQQIPWVRYRADDGSVRVFRSDGQPASAPPPDGHIRQLDCMDCHNRAGHNFPSPQESLDLALNAAQIDASLPFIKREAVSVLAREYTSTGQATEAIRTWLEGFYQQNYPEVWSSKRAAVDRAVEMVQSIYQHTIFPAMRADWRTYPNNAGHLISSGCFRCHDGYHLDEGGNAITSDCNTCHTFLYRQDQKNVIIEGKFHHEMKIHDLWEGLGPHSNLQCQQCHTGSLTAWEPVFHDSACGDCHSSGRWLEIRKHALFRESSSKPAE